MKRALPAIAISSAGFTWLLHAQGVIDADSTARTTPLPAGETAGQPQGPPTSPAGSRSSTTQRRFIGGDDDEGVVGPPVHPTTTAASPTTTSATPKTSSAAGTRTIDGTPISTRFGPVQVQVVLDGNRITDVKALQYPDHARLSRQINDQALPILHDEAIAAQSANLDGVSGATYTAYAYEQSLQAALDKAR